MQAVFTRTRVLVACLIVVLAATAASPVWASPEEGRLDDARLRLSEVRDQLEEARERRDDEEAALEVAKERVKEVHAAVGEAELAVERQQSAVAQAETRLEALQDEAAGRQELAAERAAEIYRSGGHATVASVLSAPTPGDVLSRSAYMDALSRADRSAFEETEASQRAVDAQAERLREERETLKRVLVQQEELLAEVEELREDQAIAFAEAEEDLEELESHEAYLESQSRELAAASRMSLQDRSAQGRASRSGSGEVQTTSGGGADSRGGSWTWPANGTVTSEYGMRWGRLHAGIDVAGGHGSAIMAARGGTVSYAGWMGGYGNIVLVDHGGGTVTAYAHLTTIEVGVGQSVSAGQRIGGMGCTGSCSGTHLHFEVRVNGSAQNPRNFLP